MVQWQIDDVQGVLADLAAAIKETNRAMDRIRNETWEAEDDKVWCQKRLTLQRQHRDKMHEAFSEYTALKLHFERSKFTIRRADQLAELEVMFNDISAKYRHSHGANLLLQLDEMKELTQNMSLNELTEVPQSDEELATEYLQRKLPSAPVVVHQIQEKKLEYMAL
jgi:hypothetical protein